MRVPMRGMGGGLTCISVEVPVMGGWSEGVGSPYGQDFLDTQERTSYNSALQNAVSYQKNM
jgi:hypothetical protein